MGMAPIKTLLKDLLRHAGLDVRKLKHVNSEETVIPNLLRLVNPVAVLDVGANIGQFAGLVRKVGYTGSMVSFEAIPQVHSALLEATKMDARWVAAPCAALGASRGEIDIHISKNSVSSSVLPMGAAHLEAEPDSIYLGKQSVRMERLDELAATLIPATGPLYLKIDTQGYERQVLEGSTGLLPRLAAIQVEMSLVPLYEGAPSFTELATFIEGLGYEMFSIVPGFRNVQSGRLLQVDGFFLHS
jgi:FkbM family methyltransferase